MQLQPISNNQPNFRAYYKLPNKNLLQQFINYGVPIRNLPDFYPERLDWCIKLMNPAKYNKYKPILYFVGSHPLTRACNESISREYISVYPDNSADKKLSLYELDEKRCNELKSYNVNIPTFDKSTAYIVTGDDALELLETVRDNGITKFQIEQQQFLKKMEQSLKNYEKSFAGKLQKFKNWFYEILDKFSKKPDAENDLTEQNSQKVNRTAQEPTYIQNIRYLLKCNEEFQRVFDDLIKDKEVQTVNLVSDIEFERN